MKTVFTSDEIPHLWAHARAEQGRSASALSFRGSTLLSYSTWIGERLANGAFLLNLSSYSVSTSKHQKMMSGAIPEGATVFALDRVERGNSTFLCYREPMPALGRRLFDHYLERSADYQKQAAELPARRRVAKQQAEARAAHFLAEAQRVSDFFKLRRKVDPKAVARLAKSKAREEERRAKERAERAERAQAAELERVREWLAGGGEAWLRLDYSGNALLRLSPSDPEIVETSKGMRLPLRGVRLAWLFVQSKRGAGWHKNGETFEIQDADGRAWHLDAVTEHGVVAGCHRLTWAELDRFAALALA